MAPNVKCSVCKRKFASTGARARHEREIHKGLRRSGRPAPSEDLLKRLLSGMENIQKELTKLVEQQNRDHKEAMEG